MKKVIVFLSLIGLAGCKNQDAQETKVLDFGKFQLTVPGNWRSFSRQGYDSQVGGITNGRDTLQYDYGGYSYGFSKETTATHRRTETRIDNRDALIVQPLQPGKGIAGIYVQVTAQVRFNLYGQDLRDEETALRICRSVVFN